jgi:hypothetical protein
MHQEMKRILPFYQFKRKNNQKIRMSNIY